MLGLVGAGFTGFVKHQDEDNRFCISCHLHEQLFQNTVRTPSGTLAAEHFGARHSGHPERCFTCHSGEGVKGWTAVTAFSAVDAARWVLGDRHEPTAMRLPLEDRACTKCHAGDLSRMLASGSSASSGGGDEGMDEGSAAHQNFHQISDHRNVNKSCVTCHTVHTPGEKARMFIRPSAVQAECRTCHTRGFGTEM